MDPTTSPTPTNTADTENETPPANTAQPNNNKSLSFTNGALKKQHHPSQPPSVVVIYKECLKNHAASLGGHAVDGCGEFMPSPTANPTDPTSLKCAACGCHRNFHRREDDPTSNNNTNHFLEFHRHPPVLLPPRRRSSPLSSPSPPPPPLQQHPSYYSSAPHMLLALSTAFPEDHFNNHQHHPVATPATPKGENPSGRKRFRTKFSQEQKEKMLSFSEKLGWKMQRCDEGTVEEFCNEIGVGKGVLKVWMHNNKHTFSKRSSDMINSNSNSTTNGNIRSLQKFDNNNNSSRRHHHHHNDQSNNDLHVSSNGSPSSA